MNRARKELTVVKMTAGHKEALRRLAAVEGEAMAAVVRALIRGAARQWGPWSQESEEQQSEEVRDAT